MLLEFVSVVKTRVSIYHYQLPLDELRNKCRQDYDSVFFVLFCFFGKVNNRFNLRLTVVQNSMISNQFKNDFQSQLNGADTLRQ